MRPAPSEDFHLLVTPMLGTQTQRPGPSYEGPGRAYFRFPPSELYRAETV